MPPPSSLGDDLSDDDDASLETGPAAAAATGKAPTRPPSKPAAVPIKKAVEAPKGIPQDLAALFTFDKPRPASKPDVKAHIAKVLGKRRASVIASKAKEPEEGNEEPGKGGDDGHASGSDSDGSPFVLSKQMQKLVDDEKADEKRQKRLRIAAEEAKKIEEEEERALASIKEKMAASTEEAETMKNEVHAKAEEAAAAIGAVDADDTPYPSAFVRALDDRAFGTAAVERLAPRCPAPTPGSLKPFENAARSRAAKASGSAEDADVAVAEALREAIEGGFLAAAFAAEVDRGHTRFDEGAGPACDAATARWLFDAATRPESSKSVARGARDALLAAAGYEPLGRDARQPPRRRRGVFALPVASPKEAASQPAFSSVPGDAGAARERPRGPALAWAPTAGEVLEALRRLGVVARAPDAGDAGDSRDASVSLSGRSAADASDAACFAVSPPGPLKPQVFAAVQLLAAWCERDGDEAPLSSLSARDPGNPGIVSDPADAAALLAALAALRLDPRAAALAHVADAAAAALLAAASRGADEATWSAFVAATARTVARAGATHASRLSAVRWVPWSSQREQRVQDVASLVALTDIRAALAPIAARANAKTENGDEGVTSKDAGAKKKGPRKKKGGVGRRAAEADQPASGPPARNFDNVDVQSAAVSTLGGVVVDAHTTAEEAWALVSAIHHVDVALHAGAAEPTESETAETETERVARRSFMSFLKDVKAKVPRSNKAGLQSLKTLAVATYTRHQRAQQLRETKNDR